MTAKPKIIGHSAVGKLDEETAWRLLCEASLARTVEERVRYGFLAEHGRDRTNRVFRTRAEYQAWCERHYPEYYGYGRVQRV